MTRPVQVPDQRLARNVMARVASEPRPTPSRSFAAAVRRAAPRDALVVVSTAWRLATMRGLAVPAGARMRSLALALGVSGVLATSGSIALASVADVARHVVEQVGVQHPVAPPRGDPAPAAAPTPSVTPTAATPQTPPLVDQPASSERGGDGRLRPSGSATDPSPTPTPARGAPHDGGRHAGSGDGPGDANAGQGDGTTAGQGDNGPTSRPSHDPGTAGDRGSPGNDSGHNGFGSPGGSGGGSSTPAPGGADVGGSGSGRPGGPEPGG